MPMVGGVAEGASVSAGVGGIGVSDGVNVKVGSGVLEGTGVAVKRGVMLTIGARVAVANSETCASGVHAPLTSSRQVAPSRMRLMG